jgi:hypothetical protein
VLFVLGDVLRGQQIDYEDEEEDENDDESKGGKRRVVWDQSGVGLECARP